jgi:hypothetical protein
MVFHEQVLNKHHTQVCNRVLFALQVHVMHEGLMRGYETDLFPSPTVPFLVPLVRVLYSPSFLPHKHLVHHLAKTR